MIPCRMTDTGNLFGYRILRSLRGSRAATDHRLPIGRGRPDGVAGDQNLECRTPAEGHLAAPDQIVLLAQNEIDSPIYFNSISMLNQMNAV